jgi:DNA-directed RNA polymerase specialized sigma24 family protein
LPRIRRRSGLPKWLITTTHRVSRQWFDRARRAGDTPTAPIETAAPPSDLILKWEREHLVRQALRRLGSPCEELLTALYDRQASSGYDAGADRLDMPVGSIGPTRARCLRKLLDVLQAMERGSHS